MFFCSPVFFKSSEITVSAHEVARAMMMGKSLDTYALQVGTYVLSEDPTQKRRKIISPWVLVIIFSHL
jgi:hypothetical protein